MNIIVLENIGCHKTDEERSKWTEDSHQTQMLETEHVVHNNVLKDQLATLFRHQQPQSYII